MVQSLTQPTLTLFVLSQLTAEPDLAKIEPRLLPGITLVVAPITALVRDGATASRGALDDDGAVFIDGDTDEREKEVIYARMCDDDDNLRQLHVTPAMLVENARLRDALGRARISRVVVDEFHTVKEWGFYEAMADVCDVIRRLQRPPPPFTLLSATASESTIEDLLQRLGGTDHVRIDAPLVRPHIHVGVKILSTSTTAVLCAAIALYINEHHPNKHDKGIVFTSTKANCKYIATGLARRGIGAVIYHGGMTKQDKESALRLWKSGLYQVVVATVAFGLGVDDPRVRFVLHDGAPASISEWVQKDGRCRKVDNTADSMCFLSASRAAAAFCVYGSESMSDDLYCSAIAAALEARECRQCAFGLWPDDITGTPTCLSRCDACARRFSQPVATIDVPGAAKELLGVVRVLATRRKRCTFNNIALEWQTCLQSLTPASRSSPLVLLLLISLGYLWHREGEFVPAPEKMQTALAGLYGPSGTRKGVWSLPMPESPPRSRLLQARPKSL